METSTKLEEEIRKEASRLERFFPRIVSCRVAMEGPKRGRLGGLYRVRIDLGVPGEELLVDNTPTLHTTLKASEAIRKTKENEPHRERRDPGLAIHEAFREMRRRLQDYVRRLGQTKQREKPPEGTVAGLWPEEGYGFVESQGREVYFHRNSVLAGHFDRLRIGSRVQFAEEMGEKGPQASSLKLVRATRQARKAATTVPIPVRRAAKGLARRP